MVNTLCASGAVKQAIARPDYFRAGPLSLNLCLHSPNAACACRRRRHFPTYCTCALHLTATPLPTGHSAPHPLAALAHLPDPASSFHGSQLDRFSQASPLSACASPCQNYLPSSSAPTPFGRSAPNCHPCRRHSKQHALLHGSAEARRMLAAIVATHCARVRQRAHIGKQVPLLTSRAHAPQPPHTALPPPPPPPQPQPPPPPPPLTAATSLGLLRSLINCSEADSHAAAAGIIACFQLLTVPPSPSSLHVCAPPSTTSGALCCT